MSLCLSADRMLSDAVGDSRLCPPVPPSGERDKTCASYLILVYSLLYAKTIIFFMTLSTKPEVNYILLCRQRRTEPWPQVTSRKKLVKFERAIFEICDRTDKHTDTLIAILSPSTRYEITIFSCFIDVYLWKNGVKAAACPVSSGHGGKFIAVSVIKVSK